MNNDDNDDNDETDADIICDGCFDGECYYEIVGNTVDPFKTPRDEFLLS